MATDIPVQNIVNSFDSFSTSGLLSAGGLDVAWTAADVAGNEFVSSGKELVLARNTDAAPHVVDVTSIASADSLNRRDDRLDLFGPGTGYSIPASTTVALPYFLPKGWRNSGGVIELKAANAAVEFAIFRLPR